MGIRIPVEDSAPTVAFEGAVQFVFDALGEVPDFRDARGTQIELRGTLALAVLAITAGRWPPIMPSQSPPRNGDPKATLNQPSLLHLRAGQTGRMIPG